MKGVWAGVDVRVLPRVDWMWAWWMMAFVVHEVVWTLLYVVFIGVVVGELGGMFLGGIVMYCTLHYSRAPWRPPRTALTSPLLSVRVFQ